MRPNRNSPHHLTVALHERSVAVVEESNDELEERRRVEWIRENTARIERGLDNLDFLRAKGLLSDADYSRSLEYLLTGLDTLHP